MLTKDLIDQIVAVLLPVMDDAQDRKALVENALYGCPALQTIRWDGSAKSFTIQLTRLLDAFGEIEKGRPAIVAVLEEVRARVGADRQTRIDELLARLKTSTSPSTSPRVNSIPTPIEMEKPSIAEISSSDHLTVNTPRWPRKHPFRPRVLVMKGGGVKGIAYVGALAALEEHGCRFDHFVGTSAGAISAALLSVGYSSKELGEILEKTNFKEFKDGWFLSSLLLLPFRKGLYRGEAFRVWLERLLRAKFPKAASVIPPSATSFSGFGWCVWRVPLLH